MEVLEVGAPGGEGEVEAVEGRGERVVVQAEKGEAGEAGEMVDGTVEAEAHEDEAGDAAAATGNSAPGGARVSGRVPRGEGGGGVVGEGELEGEEGAKVGVGRGKQGERRGGGEEGEE